MYYVVSRVFPFYLISENHILLGRKTFRMHMPYSSFYHFVNTCVGNNLLWPKRFTPASLESGTDRFLVEINF